ncbi:MAG: radical SAM protein [Candidatus Omnitrophica bacterium]|nr:radical SAM protein [Candidatus Omnitrophota bacterium]
MDRRILKKLKLMSKAFLTLIKARCAGIGAPLVVGWAITNRCNRRCAYCSLWEKDEDELSTAQVFSIIDTLSSLGNMMISFTGGEPLVREDMGSIISYAHDKGIKVKLNSNGALVKKRIIGLKGLDLLTLSLDGPEVEHDAIRGKGSYREVMEAASIARENDIRVNFAAVLTGLNLGSVDFILEKAARIGGTAIFQPASLTLLGSDSANPMAPPVDGYRAAIKGLIDKKNKGARNIASSPSALRHLYSWPDPVPIRCAGGAISCRIEPNGDVVYCSRTEISFKPMNCVRDGFREAFRNLRPVTCDKCWCAARVDLNLIFKGDLQAILNQLSISDR